MLPIAGAIMCTNTNLVANKATCIQQTPLFPNQMGSEGSIHLFHCVLFIYNQLV